MRILLSCILLRTFAQGQKRPLVCAIVDEVRLWLLTDIAETDADVRFVPDSGHPFGKSYRRRRHCVQRRRCCSTGTFRTSCGHEKASRVGRLGDCAQVFVFALDLVAGARNQLNLLFRGLL